MANEPTKVSHGGRNLRFRAENNQYLLCDRLPPLKNVSVQTVVAPAAQAILRRAIANNAALGFELQRSFSTLIPARGAHNGSPAAISALACDLLARRSLRLLNLGPPATPALWVKQNLPPSTSGSSLLLARLGPQAAGPTAGRFSTAAFQPASVPGWRPPLAIPAAGRSQPASTPSNRSFTEKLGVVVGGIPNVPRDKVLEQGRKDFDRLKAELTSAQGLIGTIVFVLAAWAAAHLAGPVGLIIDGVLIGVAIAAIGWAAFDWFDRVAGLFSKIDDATTDAALADCSTELVNLIVELGMSAFVTLVTRAAARKLPKVSGKKSGDQHDLSEKSRSAGDQGDNGSASGRPTGGSSAIKPNTPEKAPEWSLGEGKKATKWAAQMQQRGWTPTQINEALGTGKQFPATNNLNPGNGATRYVHPKTFRSIVIDNRTRQVIHVGGDGFKYD